MRDIGCEGDFADVHRLVGASDREITVSKLDIVFRCFEDMSCNFASLLDDLIGRFTEGGTTNGCRTRAIGAHAK